MNTNRLTPTYNASVIRIGRDGLPYSTLRGRAWGRLSDAVEYAREHGHEGVRLVTLWADGETWEHFWTFDEAGNLVPFDAETVAPVG